MALELTKPQTNKYLKMLVFGAPGIGKTHFVGTFALDPRTAPLLILDFEGGASSLMGIPSEQVDIARIKTWADFNEAYRLLQKPNHGYKTVAIDSASEVHIFALLDILDKEGKDRRDPDQLQQADYGKAMLQMRKLVRNFRNLDIHLILTAHAKQDTDPREGSITLPSMAGAVAYEVPGMMDLSGYYCLATDPKTKESQRVLVMKNYAKIRAKCRTPWDSNVPNEIIEPTATKILDTLQFS